MIEHVLICASWYSDFIEHVSCVKKVNYIKTQKKFIEHV